ncbi:MULTISPECIES: hypothetical protein [Enterococcus]|uniref:hypothetical protein n=1 Tax=Enterococcus TaxID=1350 RepID=UPI000CF261BD|nr:MULTISPECIES: hypothetical protein [Enterococcus]MDQ8609325.1 hypothetical protein [Enterococcus sp. FR088]NSV80172.1 hypothetical protein [Enterococcus faecalis]PQF40918.1 hypothetical protein CUS75_10000 [Enterococcus faecalis]TQA92257.1 hypothetical protein FKY91_14175 [Enterococcus faecalis]UYY34781.1 hypothetical protein OLL95_07980 [Enterococcus faecalis]
MDNLTEKKYLYEQMQSIMEERRVLSKAYTELLGRMRKLEKQSRSPKLLEETEYQKYMISKKGKMSGRVPYSIISLKIASLLKEAGRPISNKELYELITKDQRFVFTYKNLTMNVLPKMANDKSVNVEKAYRGFWQYRRK